MSEINYLEESNTTVIKKRFAAAKAKIKELKCWKLSDFADAVVEKYPEFDNVQGAQYISECWYGKRPNLVMMELLENYLKELE